MIKLSAFADEVTNDFTGQVEFLVSHNISNIEIRSLNGKNIMALNNAEAIYATIELCNNVGLGYE